MGPLTGVKAFSRRNQPFFGRRPVIPDDEFFKPFEHASNCAPEAPFGALSAFQDGGCQFQQEVREDANFDYNISEDVASPQNFPPQSPLNQEYSMHSGANNLSNEDGMSVASSRTGQTGGLKRSLKSSSKGTPMGRKTLGPHSGESNGLKLKRHSSKLASQGDKVAKSIHRKNKALRVFEEGASVSMDDVDSSSPISPSSMGTATFVPGSST